MFATLRVPTHADLRGLRMGRAIQVPPSPLILLAQSTVARHRRPRNKVRDKGLPAAGGVDRIDMLTTWLAIGVFATRFVMIDIPGAHHNVIGVPATQSQITVARLTRRIRDAVFVLMNPRLNKIEPLLYIF